MKPVDQTVFTVPGGNCFSAALASLLEIPIASVPYFMGHEDWLAHANEWLRPRALMLVWVPLMVCISGQDYQFGSAPPGLHILSGDLAGAPGVDHAVVARGTEIVHDPLPSRRGLATRNNAFVLAPLDPAARTP